MPSNPTEKTLEFLIDMFLNHQGVKGFMQAAAMALTYQVIEASGCVLDSNHDVVDLFF